MTRRMKAAMAIALTLAATSGMAWAYWSADSVPGGHGASAATTVEQGATPTAVSTGSGVAVSWAPSTVSTGEPVTGYVVTRYDEATLTAQATTTGCAGTVAETSCTESTVPSGRWVYSVTPRLGTHWSGAESPTSNVVATDSTSPVNAVTATALSGNVFQNGATIFYRGAADGSLVLTNAVTDTGSGPASSTTAGLTGIATGWSHVPSTVSTPAGGPYVSDPFSWTAGTTSAPTEVVTGRDVAGASATTTLTLVDDSTAPSPGTISYPDGTQPGAAVVVAFTSGTDAGSGIASRRLQRSAAVLTSGICGTFGSFADVGPADPTSPYTDPAANGCYQYRYVVTDQVGNQHIATSTAVARVLGGPALGVAGSFSVLAATGVVNSGPTTVSGDLGVSPSNAISGFPPGTVAGTVHAGDPAAAAAQTAFALAYNDAAGRTPTSNFAGDLGGRTFYAGVHHTAAAMALTGNLTLDAQNDPNAIFIFQIDAALNTAASSTITLTGGARASNVYWQVTGAAGTGSLSTFTGTILAAGAITLGADSTLTGRALSQGTITLATNTIRFTSALPPAVTIDGGAAAVTKDATPTISGTTDAPVGTVVTVSVAGQVLTTTVQSGGGWTVTATAVAAGTYPVGASVRDSAGNAGIASQNLTVEINPAPVALGVAAPFSVLAATGVVNTGTTSLSGDLGVSPSNAISGFPPGTVAGTVHAGDPAAAAAQTAFVLAYNDIAGRTAHTHFAGDLGGRTFHAGVHHTAAAMALTGNLTLDAQNDPNAIFIFQIDAALNTAASSTITLTGGARAANVYWQVTGAAGTGSLSTFTGTILAAGAITLGADSTLTGRALSQGTITLATNTLVTD